MPGRWVAIVGREKTGRVAAVWSLVDQLRASGLTVGGAVQERSGANIELVDIVTGTRRTLASASLDPDVCDWAFDRSVFTEVRESALASTGDVVFMHAGRFESNHRGHWDTLLELLERETMVVLCMPPSSLARIALDLPDPIGALELPADTDAISWFGYEIQRLLRPANAA